MKLVINGELFEHGGEPRLPAVLAAYGVAGGVRVAVVLNDQVVPQAKREDAAVREGDRIEILTFAGGG
jgi:thiamine biosynthesis protein ThiS